MKTKISKRVLAVALTVVMLLSVAPLGGFAGLDLFGTTASAVSVIGDCGDYLTWALDTEIGELVISGIGEMTNYDYPVYTPWYEYRSQINSITIKDGVTSIGHNAFHLFTNLTSVTIPDSVISIGHNAFYHCSSLTSITIPDSVTRIDPFSFQYCSSLTSITIPNSVTSILYVFSDCTNLSSVTIPYSVTKIGSSTFNNCTNLSDIYYNGSEAQWESIVIDSYNDSLYNATIHFCDHINIKSVDAILETCTTYGYTAGVYCFDCGTYISGHVFIKAHHTDNNSDDICDICNQDTVPIISKGNCGDKDDSVTYLLYEDGKLVISGTGEMELSKSEYYFSTEEIPWASFKHQIKSVTIYSGVTSIDDYAFYECTNLTSIMIPDSVTSIGRNAFDYCTSLTSIIIDESNANFSSIDAVIFNKDKTVLVKYAMGSEKESYTIPYGVTSINSYAFENCLGLTSLSIPNTVMNMDDNAFFSCDSLTSVTIDNGVTSIGDFAFNCCTNLTSVDIPNSVMNIGQGAFYGTGYYNNENNWENDVLYIGNHLIEARESLAGEYSIKEGTVSIADYAFRGCRSMTNVTIPESVVSIGLAALSCCTSLIEIYIPSSVKNISEYAFEDDMALERIIVDENNNYFSSQEGVGFDKNKTTLIAYPAGKTDEAYEIPNSVTSIKSLAFYSNLYIRKISIPDSVKTVEFGSFCFCLLLDDIYYYGKETDIDPCSWASYFFTNYDKWLEYRDEFIPLQMKWATTWSFTEEEEERFYELFYSFEPTDEEFHPQVTIHGYTGSTAEAYANLYDCTFVPFFTEATDEETDINTEFDPGVFPEGTVLLIDKKGQNEDSTFNGKYEYYESFDISFVDENNVKVQPDGTVTVRIPIPQSFNPEKTVVYFVAPDGTQTKLNSWHEGRCIVFEVNHFSEYVIVDESSEIITPDEPDVPDEPDEPEHPSGGKLNFFARLIKALTLLFNFLKDLFG